jgi:hypothetical protein
MKRRNPWGNRGSRSVVTSMPCWSVTWARSAVPRRGSGRRQQKRAMSRPGKMETPKASRQPLVGKRVTKIDPMARPRPSPT